jgi:hypothetical protein
MRKEARWLIDRIMLDDSSPVPLKTREISAKAADLRHGGSLPFNHLNLEHRMSAEDSVVPDDPGAYSFGRFTRYGDVLELLAETDDMFVVMRHGDSIDLTFPKSAPPAKGMQRGFMLKARLYYKPIRGSRNIEPLPFRGMGKYPYPENETYPQDKKHREYCDRYNTREYSDRPATNIRRLLPGVNAAEAKNIEAKRSPADKERTVSQQPAAMTDHQIETNVKNWPAPHMSLTQWLGTIASKAYLAITTLLHWLMSLIGL